jgi:hypothetical protein
MQVPIHPIDELRAARRDLLAALQGRTAADLLRPGVEGDWCGRDVLLHVASWLRELACLVPDLATYGCQRGEQCDPLCVLEPDWAAWNAAQIALHRTVRPEAAVAGVVTAHARLLETVERLDDAGLRRRGPTRFGFATSGWDLLVAEAAHERAHAARLAAHTRQLALALDPDQPMLLGDMAVHRHVETLFGDAKDLLALDQDHRQRSCASEHWPSTGCCRRSGQRSAGRSGATSRSASLAEHCSTS